MDRIEEPNPLAKFKAFEQYSGSEVTGLSVFGPPGTLLETSFLVRYENLKTLALSNVQVEPALWEFIQSQSRLEELDLKRLGKLDSGVCSLSGCSNLRRLDMTASLLPTNALASFSKLCKLEILSLVSTGISTLESLTTESLRELALTSLPIDDSQVEFVLRNARLDHLHLEGTLVSDVGIKQVSLLPNLRFLAINNTNISKDVYQYVGAMTELEELYIDVEPDSQGLIQIANLKRLKRVYCGDTIEENTKLAMEKNGIEVY